MSRRRGGSREEDVGEHDAGSPRFTLERERFACRPPRMESCARDAATGRFPQLEECFFGDGRAGPVQRSEVHDIGSGAVLAGWTLLRVRVGTTQPCSQNRPALPCPLELVRVAENSDIGIEV